MQTIFQHLTDGSTFRLMPHGSTFRKVSAEMAEHVPLIPDRTSERFPIMPDRVVILPGVTTWADGYGMWWARVPDTADAEAVARCAIVAELALRESPNFAPSSVAVAEILPSSGRVAHDPGTRVYREAEPADDAEAIPCTGCGRHVLAHFALEIDGRNYCPDCV